MSAENPLEGRKAVLFDVDGTLIDTLAVILDVLGETMRRFAGIEVPSEDLRAVVGMPLREEFLTFCAIPEATLEDMVKFAVTELATRKHLETEFEPAVKALRYCYDAGLKTALVTSKSRPELDLFLNHFSGKDCLHTAVCATDVFKPKPHPEIVHLACEHLGCRPDEAFMIGDSIFDIQSARSAGSFSIGVAYGSGPLSALRAEQPDVLIETPAELLAWLTQRIVPRPCEERNQKNLLPT
jgi:HAD superfamily hydrolase (TIGR01549 family)